MARELTAQESYVLFCACQMGLRIYLDRTWRPIDTVAFETIFRDVSARADEFRESLGHDHRTP